MLESEAGGANAAISLTAIAEYMRQYLSQNIANNDIGSSALFAALLPAPFVFVTPGTEGVQIAKQIFDEFGFKTKVFDGTADFCTAQPHDGTAADILIIDDTRTNSAIAETQIESVEFKVGDSATIGQIKSALEWFEYEFVVKGDIIDTYGLSPAGIVRIMLFDNTIEDIKLIDASTLSAIKKLPAVKIEKETKTGNSIPITAAIKNFTDTVVLDNARNQIDLTGFTVYKFREPSPAAIPFPTAVLPNYHSAMSILTADITEAAAAGKTVVLFAGKSKTAENYLRDKNVPFVIARGEIIPNKINIICRSFPCSTELKPLNMLIYSLTPPPVTPQPQGEVSAAENIITKTNAQFIMPAVGDCVVHSLHGIGRYIGTKRLSFQNNDDDYLVIQYDGGAVVYIPVSQADTLSNYIGEPARLNRIGGQDFANAKQRVRKHLKELSFKLSELYEKRAGARPNIYEINPDLDKAFAETFKHKLTADQEKVIREITADMKSSKIMDRLVCGDVGYGKTEIAFRTAFNAVMNGFQVALLCPTTILSVQHYNLAVSRFTPFGVKVGILNRFATVKETRDIIERLRNGEIDFIIGTHKMLSLNKTDFNNLGLLILDEEQRFGVEAKEKIKKMTNNVDILTMSATPIPRTLNLSLMGLRDISVITTPPKDRLSVITYTCEFSFPLLVDAINRETARGGQTIVLYNDVRNIKHFTEKLRKNCDKNIKINFVHGQMGTAEIEDAIAKIYEQDTDVIIASTIIENGIDISTANTLFVINADRLGVAQMHQLRGRVGRGTVQAYAYFTYAKEDEMSAVSRDRINAIKNFYTSGAGFNIAMRDLELRGGGEVLGANQSGHIEEIGMEAFAQILNEIAEENRAGRK
jgi:transcription-repair coupling factor (superfamily II helicase)